MHVIGLPVSYVQWVKCCTSSLQFPICINGGLKSHFPSAKGFETRRFALSPHIFVMLIEVLSKLLNRAAELEMLKYHP